MAEYGTSADSSMSLEVLEECQVLRAHEAEPPSPPPPTEEAEVQLQAALAARRRGDYAEAVVAFNRAVEEGSAAAMLELGWFTNYGGLGLVVDVPRALRLYRRAALRGYGPAQTWAAITTTANTELRRYWATRALSSGNDYAIAFCLEHDLAGITDKALARVKRARLHLMRLQELTPSFSQVHYQRSSDSGYSPATRRLGNLADEEGRPQDSFALHLLAAKDGLPSSQRRVAELYADGTVGVSAWFMETLNEW
jgi:TPR repeat protein